PMPVTTTLRSTRCIFKRLLLVLVDEVDGVLHGLDVLGFLVRDLDLELLFHRHHQLDDVEGIRAQVLDEGALRLDLVLAHAELLGDDALDLRLDGHAFASVIDGMGAPGTAGPKRARPCSTGPPGRKCHRAYALTG